MLGLHVSHVMPHDCVLMKILPACAAIGFLQIGLSNAKLPIVLVASMVEFLKAMENYPDPVSGLNIFQSVSSKVC